jgi:glycosyltransferase involved in cell wall biosynthesis
MNNDLTIFIINTGSPSFDDCLSSVKKHNTWNIPIKIINENQHNWKTFQDVLDECTTDIFIQFSDEIIIREHTIASLYTRFKSLSSDFAVLTDWVWNVDICDYEQGIKICNHNICINFPYSHLVSTEYKQQINIQKHGYRFSLSDKPCTKDLSYAYKLACQTPERAFKWYYNEITQLITLGNQNKITNYSSSLLVDFIKEPNNKIKRAKLFGAVSGLNLGNSNGYRNRINDSFVNYEKYFTDIKLDTEHRDEVKVLDDGLNLLEFQISPKTQSTKQSNYFSKHYIVIRERSSERNELIWLFIDSLDKHLYFQIVSLTFEMNQHTHTFEIHIHLNVSSDNQNCDSMYPCINLLDIKHHIDRDNIQIIPTALQKQQNKNDLPVEYTIHMTKIILNHLAPSSKSNELFDLSNLLFFAIDVFDWAFDNITNQVIRDAPDANTIIKIEYQFLSLVFQVFNIKTNVICFWWKSMQYLYSQNSQSRYIGLLYDHYSWVNDSDNLNDVMDKVICLGVGNDILYREMQARYPNKKIFVLKDGVDMDIFPLKTAKNKEFTFGWTGNSTIQSKGGYQSYDLKGLSLIEKCMINTNQKLITLDVSKQSKVKQSEMFEQFYNQIDCYICASESEGTPNTVFESLSCGIPVITTRVGNTSDVVIPGFNGYFIDRNEQSLNDAIIKIINKRSVFESNPQLIRASVQHFSWRLKTYYWNEFISYILAN